MKTPAFPRAETTKRGAGKAVQVSTGRARAHSRYGSNKRVLVVDDHPSIRQMFQTVLEGWGYSVVTAASGPEALRQLDTATFHGMLLDYSMPGGMTGIDVLGRVHLYDPALPVVMITATHEIMGQALAGAKTCLLKPVELSELQQAVQHHFEKAGDGRSVREEECPA